MKNKETGNSGFNSPTGEHGLTGSVGLAEMMYFHGKTVDGNNYTISGIVENDDLVLGLSLCSEKENFNKAKGRNISTGRALNQRTSGHGRILKSMYGHDLEYEFGGYEGFPKDYFKGNEIKVFRSMVCNYNYFTKKELIREFGLKK